MPADLVSEGDRGDIALIIPCAPRASHPSGPRSQTPRADCTQGAGLVLTKLTEMAPAVADRALTVA